MKTIFISLILFFSSSLIAQEIKFYGAGSELGRHARPVATSRKAYRELLRRLSEPFVVPGGIAFDLHGFTVGVKLYEAKETASTVAAGRLDRATVVR